MKDFLKNELTSVSTWSGAVLVTLGNLLPYLTPQTLTDLGVPGKWIRPVSTAIGLALIVYRQKPKVDALPPPAPEATRAPFVQTPPEIRK